jgi:hypothetical protein
VILNLGGGAVGRAIASFAGLFALPTETIDETGQFLSLEPHNQSGDLHLCAGSYAGHPVRLLVASQDDMRACYEPILLAGPRLTVVLVGKTKMSMEAQPEELAPTPPWLLGATMIRKCLEIKNDPRFFLVKPARSWLPLIYHDLYKIVGLGWFDGAPSACLDEIERVLQEYRDEAKLSRFAAFRRCCPNDGSAVARLKLLFEGDNA